MSAMPRFFALISTMHRCLKGRCAKSLLVGVLIWFVGAAALWYWLPYQPRFTLPGTGDGVVAGCSPDGQILATANSSPLSNEGRIRLWNLDTGEEIDSFQSNGELLAKIYSNRKELIIKGESINRATDITILAPVTSRELARLSSSMWQSRAYSPDGEWFVSAESPEELSVRSTETGLIKVVIPCKTEDLYDLILSPDGAMIAGDLLHKNVILWDSSSGQELAVLKSSTSPVFSRDGKRLAVFHIGNIKLWDTVRWQVIGEDHHIPQQWDAQRSVCIWPGPGPEDMRVVIFEDRSISPGIIGEMMGYLGIQMSGKDSKEMKMLDLESWKELAVYSREGEVHLLPDGRSFVDDSHSGRSKWSGKPFVVFDAPPRRPIARIALWPLPFALATGLIFWFL